LFKAEKGSNQTIVKGTKSPEKIAPASYQFPKKDAYHN